MKAVVFAVALIGSATLVHAAEMKGMDTKTDMKDMSPSAMAKDAQPKHVVRGNVKNVDLKAGTLVLDHEAVKSLDWPAMTMTFNVQDKSLLNKLGAGQKVEAEFEKRGKDYVITRVK